MTRRIIVKRVLSGIPTTLISNLEDVSNINDSGLSSVNSYLKWDSDTSTFIFASLSDITAGVSTINGTDGNVTIAGSGSVTVTTNVGADTITVTGSALDSSLTTGLIDSSYIKNIVDQTYVDTLDTYDSTAIQAQIDSDFGTRTTSSLGEGTNLYYTTIRFDSDFGENTTTNLPEGTSLYYTTARADSDANALIDSAYIQPLARAAIVAGANITYDSSTGTISGVPAYGDDDVLAYVDSSYVQARIDQTFIDTFDTHDSTAAQAQIDTSITTKVLGTANEVDVTASGGDTVTIGLPNDVTVTNNLTVGGYVAGPATFIIDPALVGDSSGKVVILGDLQVDGTTTTINSTTVSISDKNIVLADSATNSTQADGAGITVNGADATIIYGAAGDKWIFNKAPFYDSNRLLTTADDLHDSALVQSQIDSNWTNNTTNDLTEGSNLYYTTARADSDAGALIDSAYVQPLARAAIVAGANITYDSVTGTISGVPAYGDADVEALVDSAYVQPLARAAISAGSNVVYDSSTGVVSAFTDSSAVNAMIDSSITTTNIGDLFDVDITGVDDGKILKWDSDASKFVIAVDATGVGGSGIALTDLSVTDVGGFGSLSYNDGTGVFTYTGPSSGDITGVADATYIQGIVDQTYIDTLDTHDSAAALGQIDSSIINNILGTANEVDVTASGGDTVTIGLPDSVIITTSLTVGGNTALTTANTTTDLTEGSNLYYTTARADSDAKNAVSASGDLSYNPATGVFSFDVEDVYTKSNFDSDFNTALDEAVLDGVGLDYNSTTNTLKIDSAELVAYALPIRSYFSAAGDLTYNSTSGEFSFDVEQVYTKNNFDSDFNTALDSSALDGVGLKYNSTTNTLAIDSAELSAYQIPIRSYFSAAGDLTYNSTSGEFSFDVEQVYTKSNFDSDFNIGLDEAALGGVGLNYNSTTNTLNIDSAELSAYQIPIRSYFSAAGDLSYNSTSGEFSFDVEQVYTKTNFDSDLDLALSTDAVTTTDLTEGSNLYYTTARADSDATALVDKAFIDALGVEATTLDALFASQFLRSDQSDSMNGSLTVTGTISANGIQVFDGDSANVAGAGTAIIQSIPVATYDGMEAFITSRNTSNGNRQVSKVLVTHDVSNSYITEYAIMHTTDSEQFTMSADINSGNLRLKLNNSTADTLVSKVAITYL